VNPGQVAAGRALKPMYERQTLGRSVLLFDLKPDAQNQAAERQRIAAIGELRTPSIADLFVAVMGNPNGAQPGGAG
jgi:ABC-2 type transport system ATP-binding protein